RGAILRDLLAAAADEPALLELLRERAGGGAVNAAWVALLERAAARGEAPPEAVHPRVAAVPMTLLRGEYALRGVPAVPDEVLVEIVDEVFLPLVRGRAKRERRRHAGSCPQGSAGPAPGSGRLVGVPEEPGGRVYEDG